MYLRLGPSYRASAFFLSYVVELALLLAIRLMRPAPWLPDNCLHILPKGPGSNELRVASRLCLHTTQPPRSLTHPKLVSIRRSRKLLQIP